jgi:hypothetical protein
LLARSQALSLSLGSLQILLLSSICAVLQWSFLFILEEFCRVSSLLSGILLLVIFVQDADLCEDLDGEDNYPRGREL